MKNYSIEIQKLENGKVMYIAKTDKRNWCAVEGSNEIITSPNDNSCEFIYLQIAIMSIDEFSEFSEFIKDILNEGRNI
jgi:hypothetical protein